MPARGDPRADPGGRRAAPASSRSSVARRPPCRAASASSLAMAGILMMRPRLYVVDEPLANLDPATAERLLDDPPARWRTRATRSSSSSIASRRRSSFGRTACSTSRKGDQRYLGPVDGFLAIADPDAVKLPVRGRAASGRAADPETDGRAGAATLDDRRLPTPLADARPRLEFRAVRAAIGDHEILHGVDAQLGPGRGRRRPRARTARARRPCSGPRCGCCDVTDGGDPRRRRLDRRAHDGRARDRVRLRLPEPEPDALLADRRGGAAVRAAEPRSRPGRVRGARRRLPPADRRSIELEDIRARPPLALSFGQQKRLALAIALALRPATLILDEPSAGQDHRTADAFMREVLAIPGLRSLYFVTHDVDLALTHADRILLFREGRVVADGPPIEVIADAARWRACNLRMTSLMQANVQRGTAGVRFLDAEALARQIVAHDRRRDQRAEGGRGGALLTES